MPIPYLVLKLFTMKKKSVFTCITQKSITTSYLLFAILAGAMAQSNTSYNADGIPIGGTFSAAFGIGALNVNTGINNTANGYQALFSNTSGGNNTANGYKSLYSNTIGIRNSATGDGALYSNTIGSVNTAVGYQVLYANTSGSNNTGIGFQSLYSNLVGIKNTANGEGALYANTAGSFNTGIGVSSLFANTTGINNTANGYRSLFLNTKGENNTALGYKSLYSNTTGNYNVAVGDSAGFNSLGSSNIFLGKKAGYLETGSNKIYISNDSNQTMLYGDFSTGQVLFGNKVPVGYAFKGTRTLNVLGGIITDSIRVSPSVDWADYVFADDYQLKPIGELGNFIKVNKHLPNIPSAAEVASNGIELATMDAKLLEKIEELTLYILQQQKQIDLQQNSNEYLKKQNELHQRNNELLRQDIDELRKMIIKSK